MNKNYYLISPKTDFLLIGGAALITYFLVLLINIPKSFDVVFWMFVLAFFVNSPHFIISYEIFSSSVGEKILKKKSFLFAGIVVPLILILMIFLGLAFYSKEVFVGNSPPIIGPVNCAVPFSEFPPSKISLKESTKFASFNQKFPKVE
jgi:hypothetical protein